MNQVPAWLRNIPVPSQEEFEQLDREAAKRQISVDEYTSWLLSQPTGTTGTWTR